jgi:hypothetical protein
MITPGIPTIQRQTTLNRRDLGFELMRKRYAHWVDPAVI